jgi:hypothetical protein
MKIKAHSIVKPHEDERHREDRIKTDNPHFLALADGAGGQGLYAAEWAEHLLNNIPDTPITSGTAFVEWHSALKDAFYDKMLETVKVKIPDMQEKFEREGSLSTLLVLWPVQAENKLYMLSCGDSALFHTTGHFQSSISYPEFMHNPSLVSCIEEYPEEKVVVRSYDYDAATTWLMCSDTLAQYIQAAFLLTHPTEENEAQLKLVEDDYVRLSQYTIDLRKLGIAQFDFEKDIMETLWTALDSEEQFKACLYRLHDQKLLGYDDYSLIMIN